MSAELLQFVREHVCDTTARMNILYDRVRSEYKVPTLIQSQAWRTFHPQQHTLGLLLLLNRSQPSDEYHSIALQTLLHGVPEQLAFAATETIDVGVSLCDRLLKRSARDDFVQTAASVVLPVRHALKAIQQAIPNTLTPLHSRYVCVCLAAKCYTDALIVVSEPVYAVVSRKWRMTCESVLAYFYYAGCAYAGLKRFGDACEFFQIPLCVPTKSISHIQLQSYKKYVIASLIHYGKLMSVPEKPSCGSISQIMKHCEPYGKLATAFKAESNEDFDKACRDCWLTQDRSSDDNKGLVKQVAAARMHWNIRKLTNTYSKLSLAEIADTVGLNDASQAEDIIISMVSEGMIGASISTEDNVVTFTDSAAHTVGASMVQSLDAKIREAIVVNRRIKRVDRKLALSEGYLRETEANAGGGGNNNTTSMDETDAAYQLAIAQSIESASAHN